MLVGDDRPERARKNAGTSTDAGTPEHDEHHRAMERLRDENEQLRTALETALDETNRAGADRENLRRRVAMLGRELRIANSAHARSDTAEQASHTNNLTYEKQNHTEEELRVAFEELQVLAEELEVANNSLQQNNVELESRVAQRTGELAASNASLRAAEQWLRAIADLVPDLLWRADPQGAVTWYNKRWYDYTGQSTNEAVGSGWAEAVHPVDRDASTSAWARAVADGASFQCEHRLRASSGDYRWFLVRAEPLQDQSGAILQWFGSVTDIHSHRAGMEALEHSELRFRSLVEGMPQLVWQATAGGERTWSSRQWTSYTGMSDEESRGLGWLEAVHCDDRAAVALAWERAAADHHFDIEYRIFHASEARHRHFRNRAIAVRANVDSTPLWIGTSTDVDDLLQLQVRQQVLVAELQHRTRNLMAIVQAITLRTLRSSSNLEEFGHTFADRLAALGRVQALLSQRESNKRLTFDALIRDEISAHVAIDAAGKGPQVTLCGPTGIELRSATVQTFALAVHELATNAVKHGALSQPEGELEVAWHLERPQDGGPRLHVDWRESGVRDVLKPAVRPGSGFGRELIERALPFQLGARTVFEIAEDGVRCLIDMPVPDQELTQENDNG